MSKALEYLGIARMSGNLELGEENAKALVKAGKARALLLASDVSDGVKKRAGGYIFGFRLPRRSWAARSEEHSAASRPCGTWGWQRPSPTPSRRNTARRTSRWLRN